MRCPLATTAAHGLQQQQARLAAHGSQPLARSAGAHTRLPSRRCALARCRADPEWEGTVFAPSNCAVKALLADLDVTEKLLLSNSLLLDTVLSVSAAGGYGVAQLRACTPGLASPPRPHAPGPCWSCLTPHSGPPPLPAVPRSRRAGAHLHRARGSGGRRGPRARDAAEAAAAGAQGAHAWQAGRWRSAGSAAWRPQQAAAGRAQCFHPAPCRG